MVTSSAVVGFVGDEHRRATGERHRYYLRADALLASTHPVR